jgi:chromatin remodeling complex protein RSC6
MIHIKNAPERPPRAIQRIPLLESLALAARLGLISGAFTGGITMAKGTTGGGSGGAARGGLSRPVTPSADLAAITGADPLPRSQVVSKMWDYIRENKLQNPENKREILADDKLKKVFGTDRCSMFEMNKHLSRHLS